MMDLTITKCMDDTDVPDVRLTRSQHIYQKPHHQYMYIPYHSFHRRGVFKGFIKAELQRYAVANTLPADFLHMKSLFLQRLLDRGYPLHHLNRWFAEVRGLHAVCRCCSDLASAIVLLVSRPSLSYLMDNLK
jgi:hypothetical protein